MLASRPFPSLVVSCDAFEACGAFAEAQAAYLRPDRTAADELRIAAERHGVGIVAHFYMDPELQGVLTASGHRHVHISDSLVMADRAVTMVQNGARAIVVLGVDFMAENVRAVLDAAGYGKVPVYRVAKEPIGCSLAAAADAPEYLHWLRRAGACENSLHVVYINTSLNTKARAQAIVPTVTCTSSNVVATVLSAFAQIPEVKLWFGPDTYMGQNLQILLRSLQEQDEAAIKQVHAAHDRETLKRVVAGFDYFPRGNCIVHHLFGDEVARRVRSDYADALIAAHLEVPGAMFKLGLEAARQGRGVVGSTSDILGFLGRAVEQAALQRESTRRLRLVLGTEAGMVTALVHKIQSILQTRGSRNVEVEIVFPVADPAIATTGEAKLPIVPGPAGGEGCSVEGGCATCPYMKMNSLDALMDLLARLDRGAEDLAPYAPQMCQGEIAGRPLIEWATTPIEHMRAFSRTGLLPDTLVRDVRRRHASRNVGSRA
jgi:quinolinate synthase